MTDPASEETLCRALIRLCDRVDASLAPGPAKEIITGVRERLHEDVLRVAVGGRLNAGKSTLVNALLGEKLAATDETECTTKVTWFRFGHQNRIRIRFRDGGQTTLAARPLAEAVATCGRRAAEISSVEVQSSNNILRRDYTIVDTPGLDSLSGLDADSLAALREADVLVFVMPLPGDADFDALTALRASVATAGIGAISTIGVLSRIDELSDRPADPWPAAHRLARHYGNQLSGLLAAVIPVAGLIAETALGDVFTEGDMGPLSLLAGTDASTVADALYSDEDFRAEAGLPVGADERDRLLSMLGTYGIQAALEEISGGAAGATALLRALRDRSGITMLLDRLRLRFVGIADQLRAHRAIAILETATWLGNSPAEGIALADLRAGLRSVRSDLRLCQLDLAAILTDLNTGSWRVTPEIADEIAALATGRDLTAQLGLASDTAAEQIRELLTQRIATWRAVESRSPRLAARHARTVREYLESLYFSLPAA